MRFYFIIHLTNEIKFFLLTKKENKFQIKKTQSFLKIKGGITSFCVLCVSVFLC